MASQSAGALPAYVGADGPPERNTHRCRSERAGRQDGDAAGLFGASG